MRSLLELLFLSFLLAVHLPAGSPTEKQQPVRRLRVPVLVPPKTAFKLEDVQATIGGEAAKVMRLATPADDLIVMLVLDLASDVNLAQRANAALFEEIEQMPPQVHIALLRAQDGLRVIQDPTKDRSAIRVPIEAMTISGRAGLLDSIETAATIADSILAKSSVRVAVLYITDSDVANYREDFSNPVINSSDSGDLSRKFPEALVQEKISKIDAALARSLAPVFLVQISYRSDRLNEAYLNGLRQLSTTTGGIALICRSNAEIPEAIKGIMESIRDHYSLTLEPPKAPSRSIEVRLTISGPDGVLSNIGYRSRFDLKRE